MCEITIVYQVLYSKGIKLRDNQQTECEVPKTYFTNWILTINFDSAVGYNENLLLYNKKKLKFYLIVSIMSYLTNIINVKVFDYGILWMYYFCTQNLHKQYILTKLYNYIAHTSE